MRVTLERDEKLRLAQRRLGLSQDGLRKKLKVGAEQVRRWYYDAEEIPTKVLKDLPTGAPSKAEKCWILRRREGMTIEDVAKDMGISRVWVWKMEKGQEDPKELADYWGI
ncbi:MAG: hypothetical protein CMJ75_18840 [Planctomycetaceae bacterium]|nr:hypothetical protein [Planctomycetaceae bacterium]